MFYQEQVIITQGKTNLVASNEAYMAAVKAVYDGRLDLLQTLYAMTPLSIDAKGNNVGNTVLMFAAMWGKYDIVQYLIAQNANFKLKNNNGQTALDLAKGYQQPRIAAFLRTNGA